MLIKDNEGDWGVCVAVWRGIRKGVPGVAGKAILISLIVDAIARLFRKIGLTFGRHLWIARHLVMDDCVS